MCEVSKHYFIVPTDAHYYKDHRNVKTTENYNVCSDMFRFTQEPSSGSSPVFKTTDMVFLCASIETSSVLWRHISMLCRRAVHSGDGEKICEVSL